MHVVKENAMQTLLFVCQSLIQSETMLKGRRTVGSFITFSEYKIFKTNFHASPFFTARYRLSYDKNCIYPGAERKPKTFE